MTKNDILIALSQRGRFWTLNFEDLTHAEQVFRAIWELEGDVNNGGFSQYYFNNSADSAYFAPDALEEIGASAMAALVRDANSLFPGGMVPRERGARQALLEPLEAQFDALDQAFWEYPENLAELLFDYVSNHVEEIAGAESFV